MQKWEYCLLQGVHIATNYLLGNFPTIMYFKTSGIEVEKITGGSSEEGKKIAILIANLGNEGWELINAKDGYFYFKRPIE